MSKNRPSPADVNPAPPAAEAKSEPMLFLLTRLFWIGIGPIFLVLLLIGIAQDSSSWLTATDITYFVALALLPAVRWLEFRLGHAQTADGGPISRAELWRYLIAAAALGLSAWGIAKAIGNYVLMD